MGPRFITFEGLDGSGKSTHLRECAERLRSWGVEVVTSKEPGGTELGDAIRALFLDPKRQTIDGGVELLMVFASRRQHLLEVIEPALQNGCWVLCDRFTDSTFAYQGAGRGVPVERIQAVDEIATGSRRPDLTFFFDLPADAARARGQSQRRRTARRPEEGADRIDREDLQFYRRVRNGYVELMRQEPQRFVRIDSSGPLEQTRGFVAEALTAAIGRERTESSGSTGSTGSAKRAEVAAIEASGGPRAGHKT